MQQTVRFGPQAEQVQGTGCERQGVGAQGRWASGGRRLGDTWRLGGEHRQVRQRTAKRRVVFGFFFSVVSVVSIVGALQGQSRTACLYEGKAYSPGAVANMADQTHMTCALTNGEPHWVRTRLDGGLPAAR